MNARSLTVAVLLVCLAASVLATRHGMAAESRTETVITIDGMHCAGCALKVTGKLRAVAGVEKAQVDAAKALAVVTGKANTAPSPRALWEAVEKAGYKPTKLVGPAGTFTSKPKS